MTAALNDAPAPVRRPRRRSPVAAAPAPGRLQHWSAPPERVVVELSLRTAAGPLAVRLHAARLQVVLDLDRPERSTSRLELDLSSVRALSPLPGLGRLVGPAPLLEALGLDEPRLVLTSERTVVLDGGRSRLPVVFDHHGTSARLTLHARTVRHDAAQLRVVSTARLQRRTTGLGVRGTRDRLVANRFRLLVAAHLTPVPDVPDVPEVPVRRPRARSGVPPVPTTTSAA